jgi:hypothetical protein
MFMKKKTYILIVALLAMTMVGCGKKAGDNVTPTTAPTAAPTKTEPTTAVTTAPTEGQTTGNNNTDAVTTASIVKDDASFEKAISKDGTWLIATLNDLTVSKDIVLEGDFKNSKGETQRKIALYTQDDNRNITNRFKLTAPKLTIKSPKASIQHGIFKGDLYVETADFQLVDTKVEGNIYFSNDAAKNGFTMDKDSSVTGKQEVKK